MSNADIISRVMQQWMDGDEKVFWRLLAKDVTYSPIGSTPISGTYTDRQSFFDNAIIPMGRLMKAGAVPSEFEVLDAGTEVVLLWNGVGTMKNGQPYNNSYCWILTLKDGRVKKVRAYFDTQLVMDLFNQQ